MIKKAELSVWIYCSYGSDLLQTSGVESSPDQLTLAVTRGSRVATASALRGSHDFLGNFRRRSLWPSFLLRDLFGARALGLRGGRLLSCGLSTVPRGSGLNKLD